LRTQYELQELNELYTKEQNQIEAKLVLWEKRFSLNSNDESHHTSISTQDSQPNNTHKTSSQDLKQKKKKKKKKTSTITTNYSQQPTITYHTNT